MGRGRWLGVLAGALAACGGSRGVDLDAREDAPRGAAEAQDAAAASAVRPDASARDAAPEAAPYVPDLICTPRVKQCGKYSDGCGREVLAGECNTGDGYDTCHENMCVSAFSLCTTSSDAHHPMCIVPPSRVSLPPGASALWCSSVLPQWGRCPTCAALGRAIPAGCGADARCCP